MTACGSDYVQGDDDDTGGGNNPPPRIISGGGIGDGAIDGVVNVYVIDDLTRMPVFNASVRVGTVDGTTDASGLFTVRDVKGPQTISAKANGYRSEVWSGANGANVTIDLVKANKDTVPHANLSGSIGNFNAGVTVPAGHAKVAVVTYSQSDKVGNDENNIPQPNNQNVCVVLANEPCNFTVSSRIDKEHNIALVAAIYDVDPKDPNNPNDDVMTAVAYAYAEDIEVRNDADQTDINLNLIPANQLHAVTVDFGTLPTGTTAGQAILGVKIRNQGTLFIPAPIASTSPTLQVPQITAFRDNNNNTIGESYALLGIASNGQATNAAESIVMRRDITGTSTLTAGSWLAPPSGVTLTRTGGTWTAVANATATSLEITQGSTGVVNVSVFDGATSVTLPDLITLPSGQLTAKVQGLGAPGLDLTNFSLDTDFQKVNAVASQSVSIN